MIILTRLGGRALAVNPDLIERAESTPDTILTMVDGHKLVVAESLAEVVDLVRTWRATVAAQAFTISREAEVSEAMAHHPSRRSAAVEPLPTTCEDAPMTAHAAIESSLARVLRLPQRGE